MFQPPFETRVGVGIMEEIDILRVLSPGISEDLLPISRIMTFLPMSWAVFSSGLHQSDASHSGLIRARTTSQRCAAF